ncbi:DnaB-like helicase C-terminal domain-containing protein [bacterium]|nr:DnaB-like helicase C-terminal domain-containing protein [bacterium]
MYDTASQSITEVRARARQLAHKDEIGLLVLDYLQLMQPPPGVESQQQAIANISRQLKGLAKELDIPIIALSQLSRAVENRGGSKRPILSDLRDSGAIEQDADVVMFVYRKAYYDKLDNKENEEQVELDNTAEIIIGKQRNGPTGVVKLVFLEERAQFVTLETQQAGEQF